MLVLRNASSAERIRRAVHRPRAYQKSRQEALLPQTTSYVSRNLVNYCTTVRTSCTTNPQHIEVIELEGYSRLTCNKLCALCVRSLATLWP